MEPRACTTCGRPIDEHNRHVRFLLPDPVLSILPDERAGRIWGSDPLIQVQGIGAFVRVRLPIQLTDGFTLTLGTWMAIDPAEFRSVWERWDTSEYASLQLNGYLANAIPPWGEDVFGGEVTAVVAHATQNPQIQASSHPVLGPVLNNDWPHEMILAAYRSAL